MKIILAAAILLFFVSHSAIKNNRIPSDTGIENGKLSPIPKSPNAVSSQTDDVKKKVEPLVFKDTFEVTKKAVLSAFEKYGNIEIIKNNENYIHAVNITGIMKYKDDIEIFFDVNERLVHYRSASRIGYSDMGLNRKRYNEIARLYSQE